MRPLAVAAISAGAVSVAFGVAAFDSAEGGPVPSPFEAVTVKVYVPPFSRLGTTMGDEEPVADMFPGFATTVYKTIGDPPSDTGGENATVTDPFAADAVTFVGAPGRHVETAGVRVNTSPKPRKPKSA